jgi:FimV-like protein
MRKIFTILLFLISITVFADQVTTQNSVNSIPNVDTQYQQKIDQLQQSQTALTKQLQDLQQNVHDLQTQVTTLQQNNNRWQTYIASLKSTFAPFWTYSATSPLYDKLLKFAIWLTSVITIILFFSLLTVSNKKPQTPKTSTDSKIDDYDFLGSREGLAAKLDLAQAYINMEQTDLAKKLLEEVLAEGNMEQKELAKKMLTSIK